ncbi:MAG: flavohemoglobin expression-modulating QEGLA motif protein, partial [Hyphomicrobiales bacterium]
MSPVKDDKLIEEIAAALAAGEPIRRDFGRNERLHIDRPMPFLCVHVGRSGQQAARDVVSANSSYLLAANLSRAKAIISLVAKAMTERFGAFIVLDIGELAQDRLANDAPYLPPFEMTLSSAEDSGSQAARAAFSAATEKVKAKFRKPRIAQPSVVDDPHARLARQLPALPFLTVRFAPIYRAPEGNAVYPQLREQVVANVVDAGLQALAAFADTTKSLAISTHRALGRKAFI